MKNGQQGQAKDPTLDPILAPIPNPFSGSLRSSHNENRPSSLWKGLSLYTHTHTHVYAPPRTTLVALAQARPARSCY
jgi:hypothetical protein